MRWLSFIGGLILGALTIIGATDFRECVLRVESRERVIMTLEPGDTAETVVGSWDYVLMRRIDGERAVAADDRASLRAPETIEAECRTDSGQIPCCVEENVKAPLAWSDIHLVTSDSRNPTDVEVRYFDCQWWKLDPRTHFLSWWERLNPIRR